MGRGEKGGGTGSSSPEGQEGCALRPGRAGRPTWTPGFLDYVYVSFTNATAFSPTDTMPLSVRAKMLMAVEAFVSLLTVGLVAARAVNILN